MWGFPSRYSRRAATDLLVHILEWLCRLFTREPKFNGCLFILSLDSKIELQNGKIQCSESSNEAVLCHYYWRKTETTGSQEQQQQLCTVIELEEGLWKIMFLKDNVSRKSQASVLLRETVKITRECYSSNMEGSSEFVPCQELGVAKVSIVSLINVQQGRRVCLLALGTQKPTFKDF